MIVYHYTSLPVALQMLERKEIWLSAVTSACDLGEYKFAADYLKANAGMWLSDDLAKRRFIERLDSFVSMYGADLHDPDLAFYASFTTLDDNATQWMAYGDSGKGLSIAFDLDKLRSVGEMASSSKVLYGQYGLEKLAEMMEGTKVIFEKHKNEVEDSSEFGLAEQLAIRAATSCAYVKSEGFSSESEVRLCAAPKYEVGDTAPMWQIKYRASGTRIIPYIVHKFDDEFVNSIRLGPFASHETNHHAAANMLTDWGYSDSVAVKTSDLKMR